MTHDQIDEMPAGPELDALACKAVGWKRTEYRNPFLDKVVIDVRPISTDIATAMEALEALMNDRHVAHRTAFLVNLTLRRQTPGSRLCRIHEQSYGAAIWAEGDTAPLAIARALAKLGAAR